MSHRPVAHGPSDRLAHEAPLEVVRTADQGPSTPLSGILQGQIQGDQGEIGQIARTRALPRPPNLQPPVPPTAHLTGTWLAGLAEAGAGIYPPNWRCATRKRTAKIRFCSAMFCEAATVAGTASRAAPSRAAPRESQPGAGHLLQ